MAKAKKAMHVKELVGWCEWRLLYVCEYEMSSLLRCSQEKHQPANGSLMVFDSSSSFYFLRLFGRFLLDSFTECCMPGEQVSERHYMTSFFSSFISALLPCFGLCSFAYIHDGKIRDCFGLFVRYSLSHLLLSFYISSSRKFFELNTANWQRMLFDAHLFENKV